MPRLLIPIFLLVAFAGQLSAQIVAFGASNVAGAGVEAQQTWPAQLTADGHKELARLLLPFLIKALTQPTAPGRLGAHPVH